MHFNIMPGANLLASALNNTEIAIRSAFVLYDTFKKKPRQTSYFDF
jgi:hypothetical protein